MPAVAITAATPASAASAPCVLTISTTTATSYSRTSATSSRFTWTNLFGDGKDFTLTLSAEHNGQTNMAINTANNLTLYTAMQGGETLPSVRLSLDTLDLRNVGGGERVTFAFALDGVPSTVSDLSYKIKDIDGMQAAAPDSTGAERVYLLPAGAATGTYDSDFLQGAGTGSDPWRRKTGALPSNGEVDPTSTAGNVSVTTAPVSEFSLTFVANNSGRASGDRPIQNIWVGPFTFTVSNPTCP